MTKAFTPGRKLPAEKIDAVKRVDSSESFQYECPAMACSSRMSCSEEGKTRVAKATREIYAFNERKILDASHVLIFCAKTTIDDRYLHALLENEDKEGRFPNEEAKQGQHRGSSYFVDIHRFDLKDVNHWMEKQVYLNVGTLLLGASALGIDAVPIEGFDPKILDEAFALREKGFTSLVIVPLGCHSEEDFNAKLPKFRWSAETVFTEY